MNQFGGKITPPDWLSCERLLFPPVSIYIILLLQEKRQKINFHYRGKTIEPQLIANMAQTDTVERLIRNGQAKLTDEVQKALLYHINSKCLLKTF